jgi:exosortase
MLNLFCAGVPQFMTKSTKHQVCLALLLAISFPVGWHTLTDTFALSLGNDEYTHILLILPISMALIYLERHSLLAKFTPSFLIGFTIMATSVFAACSTVIWTTQLSADVQLSIRAFALVLWWIGAFVLCLGARASRAVMFPLCFLFGLVPFPNVLLNAIVALLQQGSAWSARALLVACGVPVAQDGVMLTIPGLTLLVAQECSSIRSSSMLLVTTMVLAQLLLHSPWRKVFLIGIAVPLSVAKNGLRIFAIAMLGTRVDSEYLTGRFHHQGGIIFFTIALIAVFALLWVLQRGEHPSSNPKVTTARVASAQDQIPSP